MRIPNRFKLFGQTIKVTSRPEDFIECTDRVASVSYRMNEIQLNPSMSYKNKDQNEQAFFHELVHIILYYSQDAYKHSDKHMMHQQEPFVDLTAMLLHQAITTMEYDEEGRDQN